MKTPVLIVAHRRPRETRRVLQAILTASPESAYVARDGPRPDVPADAAECAQVEEILRTAEWPGTVEYKIQEENVGSRSMIPSAIEWAFRQADRLIILEDDCLPHQSFFRFCEELLDKYRAEPRVMDISGTNPAPWRGGPSYRFSTYGSIWGWATWASSWRSFWGARDVVTDRSVNLRQTVARAWNDPVERDFWEAVFGKVREGDASAWDYEWLLARALNGGLAAMPRRNLVSNIGFGKGATTTDVGYAHPVGRLRRGKVGFPLRDPDRLEVDPRVDGVLRASYLWTNVPGLRGKIRRFVARVRGKIDYTLQQNASAR